MTIHQKLHAIKKISGLTQEKLASKLGVSFPTLNSWINGKSTPHQKAQNFIEELYKQYTGQKIIPETILAAKKTALYKQAKKHRSILKKILARPDLHNEFMLLLTFHTNSIEGSTLSENETSAVLFHNKVLPNKSLIEQMEVKNHQAALTYLLRHLASPHRTGRKINEDLILKLHAILMNGIRDDAGFYRRYAVRIVGSHVPTANPLRVPDLMEKLSKWLRTPRKDPIKHAAKIHSAFEKIHPFGDGNGRVGRLLLNAMLLTNNLPPAIIKTESKQLYYTYLNKAQLDDDLSLLEDYLCDTIEEGLRLLP
ncbi:MAG: Fic family protein [Candidatus Gracilibacteria bacterium]|jgi:Fic family protein